MSTDTTPRPTDFAADTEVQTWRTVASGYVARVRGGDIGALPGILGLASLFVIFSALRPSTFPTTVNFANLTTQAASITVLAMGVVFVLLVGEIDLSAGVTGGVASGIMVTVLHDIGTTWYIAILVALLAGTVIGIFTGILVTQVGIPSFVVTLALFMAWQGITLTLIGEGGTVPVNNNVIFGIANNNLTAVAGWALAVTAVIIFAGVTLLRWQRRTRAGVSRNPLSLEAIRIALLAVVLLGATYLLNLDRSSSPTVELRGIPIAVPLVAGLLILWTFVLSRTRYGRHIYAVGGNAEAARRAGINVRRMKISVFAICSTMAAVSGIILASRLNSVTPDAGAGNTLLLAVGAAVIGGTSLFGGRGRAISAVLGGLVIATINNGLGLLGQSAFVNFLVTGGVLLVAASIDAISRRRSQAMGQ
jgi:D-xylose transport system permease protein